MNNKSSLQTDDNEVQVQVKRLRMQRADKKIRLRCKEAKEKCMNDQCKELERLQKRTFHK